MDNLDLLLADLENASPSHHYHYIDPPSKVNAARQQSCGDCSVTRRSTPPPLPPPPAEHILNQVQNTQPPRPLGNDGSSQSYYTVKQSYSTSVIQHPVSGCTTHSHQTEFRTVNKPMSSTLTNNLSELDILLQDLNSAQFLADVDKRSSALVNSSTRIPITRITPEDGQYPPGSGKTSETDSVKKNRGSYDYPKLSSQPHPPKQYASSATQELDDIMASLSNFKMDSVKETNVPVVAISGGDVNACYAQPLKGKGYETPSPTEQQIQTNKLEKIENKESKVTPLDSMLGTLESDLNKQGIAMTTKGQCAACNLPVAGKVITALGKMWHSEHFVCAHCKQELGLRTFYERDGGVYCEVDYHSLFAPRCAYCKTAITDKCVTALGCSWHPDHFFCAHCRVPFYDEGFHEKDGQAFCKKDYYEMFAPKCGGCHYAITEKFISALNKQWHTECFVCQECRNVFEGVSFFDHDGLPYCETHYYEIRGSLCYSCQKPITGRCITAMSRKFHPEHFVCAFCLKQLNKGTFKEQSDKPYCHPCFVKLFG